MVRESLTRHHPVAVATDLRDCLCNADVMDDPEWVKKLTVILPQMRSESVAVSSDTDHPQSQHYFRDVVQLYQESLFGHEHYVWSHNEMYFNMLTTAWKSNSLSWSTIHMYLCVSILQMSDKIGEWFHTADPLLVSPIASGTPAIPYQHRPDHCYRERVIVAVACRRW